MSTRFRFTLFGALSCASAAYAFTAIDATDAGWDPLVVLWGKGEKSDAVRELHRLTDAGSASATSAGTRREPAEYDARVGATRAYVSANAGTQPGDPAKAARAIIDAVDAGAATLRLPLEADAVDGLRAKLAEVTADIDANEAVARATAFQ
jgi:hypothetical protein